MVTVTEGARQLLKEIVDGIDDPDVSLRLVADAPGQYRLITDTEREDDQVVEHEGDKVLLVGSELSDALQGVTIDCRESVEGPRLVISKE